jgi:hypothetical protein
MILAFASYVLIGSKPIVPGDAVDPPISVMVE